MNGLARNFQEMYRKYEWSEDELEDNAFRHVRDDLRSWA